MYISVLYFYYLIDTMSYILFLKPFNNMTLWPIYHIFKYYSMMRYFAVINYSLYLCTINFFFWLEVPGPGIGPELQQWQHKRSLTIRPQGYVLSKWFITVEIDFDHLAEVMFMRGLHYNVSVSPTSLFHTARFGCTSTEPTFKGRIYVLLDLILKD